MTFLGVVMVNVFRCHDRRLASAEVGQSNPRTVSWKRGTDDLLHEVRADFELYNGPRQIGVRTVARASDRWVISGSRVR